MDTFHGLKDFMTEPLNFDRMSLKSTKITQRISCFLTRNTIISINNQNKKLITHLLFSSSLRHWKHYSYFSINSLIHFIVQMLQLKNFTYQSSFYPLFKKSLKILILSMAVVRFNESSKSFLKVFLSNVLTKLLN